MNRIQAIQLDILLEIDRICKERGIRYHLAYGSQLGAVRHHGFIPWDDDLDVAMMRDDYDRFLAIAPAALDKRLVLQTWDTDPYYAHAFAKVRAKDTLFRETFGSPKIAEQGVWVDIFPFDAIPERLRDQKKMYRKLLFYDKLRYLKCGYTPWKQNASIVKSLLYLPLRFAALFIGRERLKRIIDRTMRRYHDSPCKLITQCADGDYFDSIQEREAALPVVSARFEGYELPIQSDYDTILTRSYGAYMTPPSTIPDNYHHIGEIETSRYRFIHWKENEQHEE